MAKIIGGLPDRYCSVITAWDSVEPARQKIQYLQERLLKEEKRLAKSLNMAEQEEKAAFSSLVFGNRKKFPRTSFNNNNDKYAQGQARSSKSERNNNRDYSNTVCYKCNNKGHIARMCGKKNKNKQQRYNNNTRDGANCVQNQVSNQELAQNSNSNMFLPHFAHALSCIVGKSSSELKIFKANATYGEISNPGDDLSYCWIADSGASCHMAFHHEWFNELNEIDKIKVLIPYAQSKPSLHSRQVSSSSWHRSYKYSSKN